MFDPIEIKMAAKQVANELVESGQIGTSEPGKTWTYDGDPTGKEVFTYVEGLDFIKVENGYTDLSKVSEVIITDGKVTMGIPFIVTSMSGAQIITDQGGEFPYVVSAASPVDPFGVGNLLPTGTWIIGATVRKVTIPEAVRTIDPKYLPGAVLPVVELESVTVIPDSPAPLSESDGAKLNAVVGSPAIVSFATTGFTASAVCAYFVEGGMPIFCCAVGNGVVSFIGMEGAWYVMLTPFSA